MSDPHSASADVASASAAELLARFESGETRSREVVVVLRERAEAIDSPGDVALHSVAAWAEDAYETAEEGDRARARGESRGPLHGLPVLIKDNIEARGLPGLAGSTSLRGRPSRDAELVTRLRRAGAVVVGATNLSQWANIRSPHSTSGYSATGGLVGNPWALDRSAGGSSSGSGAAVAAGLSPLSIGTETDGSITCPASLNGVVGLKPTVGNVSREGVVPISHSQDSPGPMARCVDDVARLYGVVSGTRGHDVAHSPRLVEARNWRTGHHGTDAHFDDVMALLRGSGLGVGRRDGGLPGAGDYDDELTVMLCELSDDMDAYLSARPGEGVKSLADVVAFEDHYAGVEQRYFGHEFFLRAVASGGCDTQDYREARRRNVRWAREGCLLPVLEGYDVVLAPAYGPAWKSDLVNGDNAKYVSPSVMAAAVSGWPIMAVPMGLVEGLPVGLTLVGRPHGEWTLLTAARQVEAVLWRHGVVSAPTWRAAGRG
ncbi:MAG: amidase [Acidobacteria bacterium]|nr:amidase [Acidobacteriota bacterium]